MALRQWSTSEAFLRDILDEGLAERIEVLGDQPITHTLKCNSREYNFLFTKRVHLHEACHENKNAAKLY